MYQGNKRDVEEAKKLSILEYLEEIEIAEQLANS
jgi:hypothetical protein